ncbi:MAG: hypothetical protein ACREE5_04230 [Acetobacteraceae bacterium]
MTPRVPADLCRLSHEQKDALIVALVAEIEAQKDANAALSARMAELEARLKHPPKTPGNSSTPPSRGQKGNRPAKARREGAAGGQPGTSRRRPQAGCRAGSVCHRQANALPPWRDGVASGRSCSARALR